jgi:hypothetical protein
LKGLKKLKPEERINQRIEKYSAMGRYKTKSDTEETR